MRVEASSSEQPVLPSFPTVTSLPSKDKERPPHLLSGDAKGKGPPMKNAAAPAWFTCSRWRAVEPLIVDGTRWQVPPLSRMASSVRETLDQTPPQPMRYSVMYIWKTHPGSRTSAKRRSLPPVGKVEEYQFSP